MDYESLLLMYLVDFLLNRDNNIRYVALTTLAKVVAHDMEAVQRHRNTIVDCLKDPDLSIRRRALDLIYSLVDESNIKILAHELLTFLGTANIELRADLSAKLCNVTERFAPNKRWHVDTILRVLAIAGNYVPEETTANLVNLVAATPELHAYAVQKMYMSLIDSGIHQQRLVQVACWCIGEFGDLLISGGTGQEIVVSEKDVLELIERVLKSPTTTTVTKEYLLTSLMKLTTRFTSSSDKLQSLISSYQNNMDVELQQRACEYTKIFKWDNVRKSLLERIPVVEDKSRQSIPVANTDIPVPSSSSVASTIKPEKSLIDWDQELGTNTPTVQPNSNIDIMKELFGSPVVNTPTPTQNTLVDPLEMFKTTPTTMTPMQPAPSPNLVSMPIMSPAPSAINPSTTVTAYQKNGLSILFDVVRQPATPNIYAVTATFTNSLPTQLNNFEFKAAVPKYIKLQVNAATSTVLPPLNSGVVTQSLKLMNTLHGEKPVLIKLKVDYVVNGAPVTDIADCTLP